MLHYHLRDCKSSDALFLEINCVKLIYSIQTFHSKNASMPVTLYIMEVNSHSQSYLV